MRYAVYAVLVMVGCGGLLAGVSGLSSRAPGDSFEGISWLLIGSVALGSIAVVMAIEHATSVQTARFAISFATSSSVTSRASQRADLRRAARSKSFRNGRLVPW